MDTKCPPPLLESGGQFVSIYVQAAPSEDAALDGAAYRSAHEGRGGGAAIVSVDRRLGLEHGIGAVLRHPSA